MDYSLDLPYVKDSIGRSGFVDVKNDTVDNDDLYEKTYKIAKYFKEELNYDRVPFDIMGMLREPYHVKLFTEHDYDKSAFGDENCQRVFGGCLFSEFASTGDNTIYKLEWIWFHPFYRNRGKLKGMWTCFQDEFGDFLIGKPISPSMEAFLQSVRNEDFKHVAVS